MTNQDFSENSSRYTYEKRLGNRNVDKVPVSRGPAMGTITEWFTMTVNGVSKIACIPDQWYEEHSKIFPNMERLPDDIPDDAIGYLPNSEIFTGQYRKIPSVVNAIRVKDLLESEGRGDLPAWVVELIEYAGVPVLTWSAPEGEVFVRTIQGQEVYAHEGEWVLQSLDDPKDIWPIAGSVFEKSYEAI